MVEGPYDVSLVEGSITTASDAERIQEVRRASRTLVTIGACATAGGIQALRNFADVRRVRLDRLRAARLHLDARDVDADRGPRAGRLRAARLPDRQAPAARGDQRLPQPAARRACASHSVCIDCKRRGTVCVMVAHGTPCLGSGDAHRLRRAVPGLRPRLLRLLRADGDAEHGRRSARGWRELGRRRARPRARLPHLQCRRRAVPRGERGP